MARPSKSEAKRLKAQRGHNTSVTEIMNSTQHVEGGWKEAKCPRCGWTFDAPTRQELLMPVARHVSSCMEGVK